MSDHRPATDSVPRITHDVVAIIVAVGLSTAVNVITFAATYNAVESGRGLSENATQILTTAFGGMIGLLGGYLGFRAGQRAMNGDSDTAAGSAVPTDQDRTR